MNPDHRSKLYIDGRVGGKKRVSRLGSANIFTLLLQKR
jgi:hypothetical protein